MHGPWAVGPPQGLGRGRRIISTPPPTPTPTTPPRRQGPGRIPSSRSGEILDLSKDTFHHPAVRAPWCELSPPLAGWGSFDVLREGGGLRNGAGGGAAYERIHDDGGGGAGKGAGATAINIGSGRK